MRRIALAVTLVCSLFATAGAWAASAQAGDDIGVQDMVLTVPDGWKLHQDARDEGTIILGFSSGDEYLTLFVRQQSGWARRGTEAAVNIAKQVTADGRNRRCQQYPPEADLTECNNDHDQNGWVEINDVTLYPG